jgi:ketosteroid isomerase-like protein
MTGETDNVATAKRYLAAIGAGVEFDALAEFFAPDVVQQEFPNRLVPQGAVRNLEDLRAAAARGRKAVISQRYDVDNVIASGDWVALEVRWAASMSVAIGSVPAGGEMRARFGVFLQFRDGRIARQHNYDCFEPF